MKAENTGRIMLQYLFTKYMEMIGRTAKVEWMDDNHYGDSQIYGFWHEDSFFMNIVLERLCRKTTPVDVIVTADTRGDYIEHMLKRCGGKALRIPDGYKAFPELKKLVRSVRECDHSIAAALDGPLGPRHEPKKLAFYLSEYAQMEFVGISLSYSSCIRIKRRWDHYAVPLPWSTVKVAVKNYGIVSKNAIPDLPVDANLPEYDIIAPKRKDPFPCCIQTNETA